MALEEKSNRYLYLYRGNKRMKEEKDNEMKAREIISMMVNSLSTDVVISKKPGDNYSLSGLTGISIVDLYIIFNGLKIQLETMKPLFKGKKELKECMSGLICTIIDEIYEEKEEENA